MGAQAIDLGRPMPCVGSPEDQMYSCGVGGVVSLLAAVKGSSVDEGLSDDPVMLHVTVCPVHVREVRAWLRENSPLPVETWKTSTLFEGWSQFEKSMGDTPIITLHRAG